MNKYDIKKTLEDYPLHVLETRNSGDHLRIVSDINQIIIAGMGHSAIAGEIVKAILKKDPIQVNVIRDYTLPHINSKTLVFVLSHSGDTEEAIAMYSDALKKKAKVIVITSGGKLSFLVHESNAKAIRIPSGVLPRFALFLTLFPMLNVLTNNNLTSIKKIDTDELNTLLRNPLWNEKAQEIASKIHNQIPLIYTSKNLEPVALRWKAMINQNAKTHAFCNVFPELGHSELEAFAFPNAKYHAILIQDEKDSIRDKKRFQAFKTSLKKQDIPTTELVIRGKSLLSKILSSVYLGDWVSYYLALKNKVDPGLMKFTDSYKEKIS